MPTSDGVLVLTTREKEWWWSLQEIIPAIERVWSGIGRREREAVRTLCVPLPSEIEQRLPDFAAKLTRVVLTTVTPGTVKVALLLRSQLKVLAPMTVYVHGDSTEGFHAFGALSDVLTEQDTFVVSCEAEAIATRRCFPRARVELIPFPLVDQFQVNSGEVRTNPTAARLVYIGRLSEQKNLHTLLFALWLLRTSQDCPQGLTLDVYGGEDDLGSPNMGLKVPGYGTYLRQLAESLGLADVVTWHGPKSRDWLFYDVHLEPHVFVSSTLHSDENFGSSVLASLVNGHQVVTTAWGGHLGFEEWFPRQLTLVPVRQSTRGPVVHPGLLANAILGVLGRRATAVVEDATLARGRAEFSEGAVTTRTLEMLSRSDGEPVPLEKSPTHQHLDGNRARFGGGRKIYADYADPVAQIFFRAYGMGESLTFEEHASYVLPPWVTHSDHVVRVVDPHRGYQDFDVDAEFADPLDVTMCPSLDTCRLSESLVRNLVAQGYAFSLPLPRAPTGKVRAY